MPALAVGDPLVHLPSTTQACSTVAVRRRISGSTLPSADPMPTSAGSGSTVTGPIGSAVCRARSAGLA